jgi:hypothetical protein
MYRDFLTARSPLRLLEKGLHGGLGKGNLGLVLAGHGVGKTSFLVGVALDVLLRGEPVLHVVLDKTVAHTRAFYDTVFDDLASSTRLEDEAVVHEEVDRLRSIRAYPAEGFGPEKLREALKQEEELGSRPALLIVEGFGASGPSREDILEIASLAGERSAEIWVSAACPSERVEELPPALQPCRDLFSVILALEPETGSVALRALKDHDRADVSALRVALDPRTLLLIRG